MVTGKALNGKPYAGNPHVRFDEGEVAPAATPRRGSLLYKQSILAAAALVAAAAGAWQQAPGMKTPWGEKVTPENAWREYPRPQMARDAWSNLNGLWQYAVTRDAPGVPSEWDGEILVPFVIESSLSGVGRLLEPQDTLWYRRSFDADVQPGTRLLLHFEQADFRAMVFVNGVEAGLPHEGGQMPFTYDITDLVKKGANELVVSIWDPTGACTRAPPVSAARCGSRPCPKRTSRTIRWWRMSTRGR